MKLTLAFQEKLSQHTRDNLDKSFLNLSTCSLHPVYTAFRWGITNIFFNLDQFFTDIHFLFGLSSIRREDYRSLHFLINMLKQVTARVVEQWDNLTEYFLKFLLKQKDAFRKITAQKMKFSKSFLQ